MDGSKRPDQLKGQKEEDSKKETKEVGRYIKNSR